MTTLDPRFSDPDSVPTSWDDTVGVLESADIFWITTVRAGGRPHVTPLVAVWHEDALAFCTGPTEQKALNLRSNPNVILTTGCNQWTHGLDVVVEGRAERVIDPAALERLAAAWRTKWDGQWQFEVGNEVFRDGNSEAVVYRVRPAKVLAFGKQPFTHTRHKF